LKAAAFFEGRKLAMAPTVFAERSTQGHTTIWWNFELVAIFKNTY
jgi:hypothetical protein